MNKKQSNIILTLSIVVSIILIIQLDFLFISQSKRVILGLIINSMVTLCFWTLYIYSRKIYDPSKDPLIKNVTLINVELKKYQDVDEKLFEKYVEEKKIINGISDIEKEYQKRVTTDNFFAIMFHSNLIGEIEIKRLNVETYEIGINFLNNYQKDYFEEVIKGLKEYLVKKNAKKVIADIYLKETKDYYLGNGFVDIKNKQDRMECTL